MGVAADVSVRQCYVNKTNQLRDEQVFHPRDLSRNIVGAAMFSSDDMNSTSHECLVMQSYIDCLVENDYNANCPVATELELRLLSHMAGKSCTLKIAGAKGGQSCFGGSKASLYTASL